MQKEASNKNHNHDNIESITPSGYFGSSKDNIVELENFLTPQEVEKLSTFARSNTIWDYTETHINENGTVIYDANMWADRVATRGSLLEADPTILDTIENMIARLKQSIEEFFNVEVQPTGPAVVRWPVGTEQRPHADKELHEGPDAGTPNDFPYYDIASIFYLNDDYVGGELYFPLQDIEFKPKKGAAYFFPGDKNYIHGVQKVIEGCRYTSPFFWTIIEHKGK